MGRIRNFEAQVFRQVRRGPPEGKVHRITFWLLIAYVVLLTLSMLPGAAGSVPGDIAGVILPLLIAFAVALLWQVVMRRLLWKVRNRLIVTYVLMGLTPVVLGFTLMTILLYVFSGQFAIFSANSVIGLERAHISSLNRSFAIHAAHTLAANPKTETLSLPEFDDTEPGSQRTGIRFSAFADGRSLTLTPKGFSSPELTQVPAWTHGDFSGVVLDGKNLYVRAVDTQTVDGATVTTLTSLPLEKANVDRIASGLGTVAIIPDVQLGSDQAKNSRRPQTLNLSAGKSGVSITVNNRTSSRLESEAGGITVHGGSLPAATHFYDIPVTFIAPLTTLDWKTGQPVSTFTRVDSRPSLLYQRLFSTSLQTAAMWQDALIAIAVLFGLLELLAFILAVRINRTITKSIRDLYAATEAIDHGNLDHRIQVTRKDQLAALSRSFNVMTSSLARLVDEQREKERLQNELSIAQEVQANLFPQASVSLPMLELHGACYPARTVSGDYYDFLLFGDCGLGLALGDISGKGISAALLMATLHSAVRAFRFAGEERVLEGTVAGGTGYTDGEEVECGEMFEEPARILAMLNRHLYRSTQPEKYATLFLARYDGASQRLVYSTGGHLPPLLLRTDDTVTRLDRGGTVVGLIDNVSYEQGSERLHSGDILIAYSDGITEPENEFGEFGEERLVEIVRRHRHLPLEAISEQVMQALRSWIGGQEQPDDITLVLARQR